MFGTDKWVELQNHYIAKQFSEIVRNIESLYRNDAARQVEAAQRNVLQIMESYTSCAKTSRYSQKRTTF